MQQIGLETKAAPLGITQDRFDLIIHDLDYHRMDNNPIMVARNDIKKILEAAL